ncbi:hypothetical protein TWF718_005376 [Orbilia javanica]|uniref:Uncharacterized protein n=1 Tax=Orbilia javanica TaxID=47235 RepID=A0AAN8N1C3_9PEZI
MLEYCDAIFRWLEYQAETKRHPTNYPAVDEKNVHYLLTRLYMLCLIAPRPGKELLSSKYILNILAASESMAGGSKPQPIYDRGRKLSNLYNLKLLSSPLFDVVWSGLVRIQEMRTRGYITRCSAHGGLWVYENSSVGTLVMTSADPIILGTRKQTARDRIFSREHCATQNSPVVTFRTTYYAQIAPKR